jgi:hypothetical protein
MRRFPPPWTIEALDGGYKVVDANKQAIPYVYGHADQRGLNPPYLDGGAPKKVAARSLYRNRGALRDGGGCDGNLHLRTCNRRTERHE